MAWKDVNKEVDEEKVSKINAAGLINITLENLWRDCYKLMASGHYGLWNIKLDSIWVILGGDEKDENDTSKDINKLDLEIYKQGVLSSKSGKGFNAQPNPNNAMQYQLLKRKSLFLRRLQNKQGKGTSYHSDDDYDFD